MNNTIKILISILLIACFPYNANSEKQTEISTIKNEIIQTEKARVIRLADSFLLEKPVTVTSVSCTRSAGGIHDYYSEATYWWPNPADPNGPYIRKDGLNNPANFDTHRQAISQFSWVVGTETSAYLLTGKKKYAVAAVAHLKAWFVNSETLMNPNFLYAQAIKGVNTGRGIGIIDGIPFIEVTKSIQVLENSSYLSKADSEVIHLWFKTFMTWLNTHPYGIEEMNAKNNHGTWWQAQVAAYARLVGDKSILEKCRKHYVEILLPTQMAKDGSLPLEIEITKPYSYSLFCLDGFATLAWLLTDKDFNGWNYQLPDGRGMQKGVDYIEPYVVGKGKWPFKKDISHWDEQPGRRPFMFFAAMIENKPAWVAIWKKCSADFPNDESKRNMPLKNPILWLGLEKRPLTPKGE
ncbi:MAG: alginate lyase family protein [Paludibacter sp.]